MNVYQKIANMFHRTVDVPMVSFDTLSKAEPLIYQLFGDDIEVIYVPINAHGTLLFYNIGKKGGKYALHLHNCVETCRVISGKVKFKSKAGTRIIGPGQHITFHPYIPHEAEWIEEGEMFVEFNKVYE